MSGPPDIAELAARAAEHVEMVKRIDRLPSGHVRLETGFRYPDGAAIDLFLVRPNDLLTQPVLSDLAATMTWLSDLQVKPWQSKKRQRLVDDILHVLGVRQNGGALETAIPASAAALADAIVCLGQACVRVADISFTRRSSLQVRAVDEVEEILSDADLVYEANFDLSGRLGNVVQVDFLVHGLRSRSAVLTLSSQNNSSAHSQANEVFRKWYDLEESREQHVTIFDDRFDVYRAEDLKRIEAMSTIVPLSQPKQVIELLAA